MYDAPVGQAQLEDRRTDEPPAVVVLDGRARSQRPAAPADVGSAVRSPTAPQEASRPSPRYRCGSGTRRPPPAAAPRGRSRRVRLHAQWQHRSPCSSGSGPTSWPAEPVRRSTREQRAPLVTFQINPRPGRDCTYEAPRRGPFWPRCPVFGPRVVPGMTSSGASALFGRRFSPFSSTAPGRAANFLLRPAGGPETASRSLQFALSYVVVSDDVIHDWISGTTSARAGLQRHARPETGIRRGVEGDAVADDVEERQV